jgi:hypothetical protein
LGEVDAATEVRAAKVSTPEVRATDISSPQVGRAEVGADEQRTAQIRPNEVGAVQIGSREIGCAMASTRARSVREAVPPRVLPAGFLSDQCARPVKQDVDVATTRADVQRQKGVRAFIREAFHLVPSLAQLRVKRASRLERQRVRQVPQQLVQCLDDGNDGEHSLRYLRIPPPILPGERRLGDLLPGAVTVVGGATGKAAFS